MPLQGSQYLTQIRCLLQVQPLEQPKAPQSKLEPACSGMTGHAHAAFSSLSVKQLNIDFFVRSLVEGCSLPLQPLRAKLSVPFQEEMYSGAF